MVSRSQQRRTVNTYNDGLNFASGTSDSTLEHNSIRNNGDDATATWSSDKEVVPHGSNNTFRYNTVECVYRASGIAIFGGQDHHVHHCVVRDTLAGAGVRVNSVFPGWSFPEKANIRVHDITLIRCGTRKNLWDRTIGAINLTLRRYNLQDITFSEMEVLTAAADAVRIQQEQPGYTIKDVGFRNIAIDGTGADGMGPGYGLFVADPVKGWITLKDVRFHGIATENATYPSRHFEIREREHGGGPHSDAQ